MWQTDEYIGTRPAIGGLHADREHGEGLESIFLMRVIDEVDYGVMVIDGQGKLRHANHLARHEMASARLIMSRSNTLLGVSTELTVQIEQALGHALRGQRGLVLLGQDGRELSMTFIPLSHPLEVDAPLVLVMLSRRSASENLAVRMFARAQNLSPTEESVLVSLCRGLSIPEIATENGVAESTVRSQIKALREKTRCSSIRQLMQRVNSLPPVVPALRIVSPMPHNAMEFAQP